MRRVLGGIGLAALVIFLLVGGWIFLAVRSFKL
jgi:hypothetical protein